MQDIGECYDSQKKEICRSLWRGFLLGTANCERFPSLPEMPDPGKKSYLALVQIVRWTGAVRDWRSGLLATALDSFVNDIFEHLGGCIISAFMQRNVYTLLIQPNDASMTRAILMIGCNISAIPTMCICLARSPFIRPAPAR